MQAVCKDGSKDLTKQRKLKKLEKKFLTKRKCCVKINKLTARAGSDTVPCKLNNVKTN